MSKQSIKIYKNGKLIDVPMNSQTEYKKGKVYLPLEKQRIIGVDTESLQAQRQLSDGRTDLRTISVQMQTWNNEFVIDTINHDVPFTAVFDSLWGEYSQVEKSASETEERKIRKRKDGDRADGRRTSVPITLLVFYNLAYDIGRLWHLHTGIRRTIKADLKNVRLLVEGYEVEVVTELFRGSCPGFEYYVRKDKRVMRLIGMDIGAYWKGGLDKTAQALLGESKLDIAKEIFQYTLEDFLELREQDKQEIKDFWEYAARDARLTRDIYIATVHLLVNIKPEVIKRNGTLPASAPGAAAKMAFSMGPDKWVLPTASIQQAGAYSYAGARVFNYRRGYCENISVLDINSAYPHVMTQLPDPASCEYVQVEEYPFALDLFKGKFGVLCVSGTSYDDTLPAIRRHDPIHHRLQYVYGSFEKLWITIPEAVLGVLTHKLDISWIHTGYIMEGSKNESFLRKFVLEMHLIKENEKNQGKSGSAMYLAAKLLMNSLYGKLVEVKLEQNREYDDEVEEEEVLNIFPLFEKDKQKLTSVISELSTAYSNEGLQGVRRIYDVWSSVYPTTRETIPFFQFRSSYDSAKAKMGNYFLAMHAANITGFTSAKLGVMLTLLRGVQADTDSVMTVLDSEDIEEGLDEYHRIFEEAGYDHPKTGLGSFEVEVTGGTGYLVKNKLYAIKYKKGAKTEYKIATHGISGLALTSEEKSKNPDPVVAKKEDEVAVKEAFYQMAKELTEKDDKVFYPAKSVTKTYSSFVTGKIAGEFLQHFDDDMRSIQAKDDPNQWIGISGERHWYPLNKEVQLG